MRIQQLSPQVANQIAAGEVIERPASVVKELLENALDAGASVIHVVIDYGGINRIKISDDGQGIPADDLPLAILAHATSKISKLDDLYTVSSMGFRGEALASIASVSKLTISSKPKEQDHASLLCLMDSGPVVSPTARNQGTTVDVQDLFYNAPVRKKFLKNEKSEYQAIETVVKRFALCRPNIAISLMHNGKQMFSLLAAFDEKTRVERIKKIFGKTFVENAIYVTCERGGMRLEGWISHQDYHRSQNDKQWVYINQRMVRDKLLNHAIKQSYESILPPGRFPACLLYLKIPANEVDVNVHPTKHEVRFQQPRLVRDLIISQFSKALGKCSSNENYNISISGATNKSLAVCEQYPVQLAFNNPKPPRQETIKEFTVLNSSFAIIFYNSEPFLINMKKLQQESLINRLKGQALPFNKRPLLVAVSVSTPCGADVIIDQYQSKLSDLGIEMDMIADRKLIIRTIPTILPQLDIQQLISALARQSITTAADLMELLVECHPLTEPPESEEEKYEFTAYIETVLSNKPSHQDWYRPMDIATCEEILNG